MKRSILTLLRISRPRFWMYIVGPYLVGFSAGATVLNFYTDFQFWLYFGYFLIPVNLYLYGINDLSDTDTDQFNNKKKGYESLFQVNQQRLLVIALIVCCLITVGVIAITASSVLTMLLILLVFLSFAYSHSLFRWKALPFIDSASNVLYVLPGIIGYYLASGRFPTVTIILAGWSWTAAMHLFSAIPDIQSDNKVGLKTTAVVLGEKKALILSSVLWFICMLLVILQIHSALAILLIAPYVILPILCIKKIWTIFSVYQFFPFLNTFIGFCLFWLLIFQRFS